MEHRIVKDDEGVSPVIAVILMVAITVVLAAVLYVWAASFLEQGESAPIATFFVEESSSGVYHVEVIKVSKQEDLAGFSYFLKDETGSTHVGGNGFGEIAMQIVGGQEHGIDTSYSDSCDDNCDSQLESRASNVSADDGTDYPVHFSDNDRDGKLSAGDQFMVYGLGNSANGPAEDNWKLDIQFDASGDIIGSARML
jgi:flagellin-like protein